MNKDIDRVIENHRKMWNWIADAYENGARTPVGDLKEEYLRMIGNSGISGHCFLCDYAGPSGVMCNSNYSFDCTKCLLDWGTPSNSSVTEGFCVDRLYYDDEEGLYGQLLQLTYANTTYRCKDAAKLARQIANLPERR